MSATVNDAVSRILSRLNTVEERLERSATNETPLYWDGSKVGVNTLPSGFFIPATFSVHAGTLGQNTGDQLTIANFGVAANNLVHFQLAVSRTAAGSDWTSAALILGRITDASGQGYISWYGNNIGVNTSSPAYTLSVGAPTSGFQNDGSVMRVFHNASPIVAWNTGYVDISQPVQIAPYGTTGHTEYRLYVVGASSTVNDFCAVFRNSSLANLLYIRDDGELWANRAWITSDRRAKKNIKPLPYGLATIRKMKTYQYQLKDSNIPDLSFMADEIADPNGANLPELVMPAAHCIVCGLFELEHTPDMKNPHPFDPVLTMNREAVIPILVKALQELADKVDAIHGPPR